MMNNLKSPNYPPDHTGERDGFTHFYWDLEDHVIGVAFNGKCSFIFKHEFNDE
jgi:hypothetical protein